MASEKNGNSSSSSTSTRGDKPVFANASVFKAAAAGISQDESTAVYDAWASAGTYDQDMDDEKYQGAEATAKAVLEMFPKDRDQVAIIDLACGTGIVAEKLYPKGFRKMDGLDPSAQMLDVARPKKVYTNLYTAYLDHNPLPMKPDTYDCAVMAGALCPNHVPVSGLRSMVRVVKPGGLMVMTMREAFLWEAPEYRGKLEREMGDMEREGLWRQESRTPLPNYFYHHTGVVFIFRKC